MATLLITSLAVVYVSIVEPTYKATATVEITGKSPDLIRFDGAKEVDRKDINFLQTQIEVLRSRGLAQRVIDKLELNQAEEFLPDLAQQNGSSVPGIGEAVKQAIIDNQIINIFLEKLTVKQVEFTRLVMVTYESKSADLAANIANAIAAEYIESSEERRNEQANKAIESISLRLSSLKANVEASENKLLDFKLSNKIINVGGTVGRLEEQELLLSATELVNAKSSLSQISNLRDEIEKVKGNPKLLETLPQIYNDPLVTQTRMDLDNERRTLWELSNKYGNKHPIIVNASSRIDSLSNSLRSYTLQIVNRIEKEYQQLTNRVELLESKLQTGKSSIQDLGATKIELEDIEDEVATNREIYNTFFNRLLEFNSIRGMETNQAEITDLAFPPTTPSKPNKKVIVFLALLGSLILSSLVSITLRIFDDTIGNTRDVDLITGLKLLGIIPDSNVQKRKDWLPWFKSDDWDSIESINILCTNIRMADKKGLNKLIMITSSAPDEGKTTTAIELAAAMSKTEKVLLVDADLRKGSLSRAVGKRAERPGLTNLILGSAKPIETIQHDIKTDFDFMSCGSTVDQPLALMSSKSFERVLSELAFIYDRVIIDCPPVYAVSDTKVIAGLVDSVIYLIKAKSTPSLLAKRGINALREVNANILGAVVTQVNVKNMNNFGGVYDFHGFHDHYGYAQPIKGDKILKIARADLQRLKADKGPVIPR